MNRKQFSLHKKYNERYGIAGLLSEEKHLQLQILNLMLQRNTAMYIIFSFKIILIVLYFISY